MDFLQNASPYGQWASNQLLRQAGVSEWRIRTKTGSAHHGVRIVDGGPLPPSFPPQMDERWFQQWSDLAALQMIRPDAIGSHSTAALLHGLILPRRMQQSSTLHVSTGTRGNKIERKGVRGYRKTPESVGTFFGVRLSTASAAVLELAPMLELDDMVRLLDGLMGTWNGDPRVEHAKLKSFIRDLPQSRAYRTLRKALRLARPGVQSPQETTLRLEIVRAGLPEPTVNPRVYLTSFSDYRKPDLAWEDYKVCCEYEGAHHMLDAKQWSTDIRRHRAFEAAGWIVIRVTKSMKPVEYLAAIRDALRSRGWRG
ncbi:hypothetical protein [Brevibacterium sp. HMSC07C04]|uniref:hypothetical protein n=1 Tax=Brevibacterium sp. HMSC07C04 TaxID=1581130 RepID=UPI0008A4EB62|nr:hypothetical protein [Brevibacterium sp. HMSC07C04]OFS27060.1 hypothetical protein HMPREF3162_03300 [Brevibacterium sp. HMSC07C04]